MAARHSGDSAGRGDARPVRVLLAEETDMYRTALVSLLSAEEDIEVVANVRCDPKTVVATASRLRPDVAVVATDEEDDAGLATIRALRADRGTCRVIALTVGRPRGLVNRLVAAGVSGVADKKARAPRLLHAIRSVANGDVVLDDGSVARDPVRANPFTRRERDVLRAAARGVRGPEIAKELSLSPGTVRNYLSSVMTKTGARNRIDAIRIAKEAGWF